jgi:hypothetical protein
MKDPPGTAQALCLWCNMPYVPRARRGDKASLFCQPEHGIEFRKHAIRHAVAAVKRGTLTVDELRSAGPGARYRPRQPTEGPQTI